MAYSDKDELFRKTERHSLKASVRKWEDASSFVNNVPFNKLPGRKKKQNTPALLVIIVFFLIAFSLLILIINYQLNSADKNAGSPGITQEK